MTWPKAAPVVAVSVFFDVLRIVCDLLWLLAPLFIGAGAGSATSAATGSQTAGVAAGAVTAYFASFGTPFFVALGTILAMAVGMMGFIALIFALLITNPRVLGEILRNPAYFLLGLGTTQVPFVSAIPALTLTTIQLYRRQIKAEKATLAAWHAAHQQGQRASEEQRMLRAAQMREDYESQYAENAIPEEFAEAA
jgi:hypothetical protein